MVGQFPAETGWFDAAERQTRIGFDHAIDEAAAGMNLPRDFLRTFWIAATDAGTEAEAAVVIASHVADLIQDGDCIQIGVGAGSEAMYEFLKQRRHLWSYEFHQ